jgi:CO/xanthine dehydrogenase FAD-binding subunit
MKPAKFDYHRAKTVSEACACLAATEDARLIAGGQTLIPMMAMRLARPVLLIDIGRIPDLQKVDLHADRVTMGACVRQGVAERHPLVHANLPLLARALPYVGHAPTRSRGTVGGSIANADPAAEIPLVLTTLGGAVTIQRGDDTREVLAADLFEGPMMTCVAPDACITAVHFPVWPIKRLGTGFLEVSARQSDFAYVSAAAQVALAEDGTIERCAVGVGGAPSVPTALIEVVQALTGRRPTPDLVRDAVRPCIDALDIMVDAHASRDYRRRVAAHFVERALLAACKTASGGVA